MSQEIVNKLNANHLIVYTNTTICSGFMSFPYVHPYLHHSAGLGEGSRLPRVLLEPARSFMHER
jgi:hypothetical protein